MNKKKNLKEIPLDIIEKWLSDEDWRVRQAAMNVCKSMNISAPVIRTIEPPEKVYKKCLGGVIVVAEIPKDAEIRGNYNSKCRASKAKIIDIIGDLRGEKVGISAYDCSTCYFIGDEIEVEDFDKSFDECSKGYHFFCKKEMAENYNM